MNKLKFAICFIVLCIVAFSNVYAVQDSLFIYTKPGCSNCHSAKQALEQSGIPFIEKSLDNKENAAEMLHKISVAGFHDKIYLPVIFVNHKLYHPAYSTDTGLVSVPLSDVVDSIKNKYQRGELNLPAVSQPNTTPTAETVAASSDCEVKVPAIYLVCANYTTEAEALTVMNKLIKDGFIFAGIVNIQKQYKVFCKIFTNEPEATSGLTDIKNTYKDAYLYEMP